MKQQRRRIFVFRSKLQTLSTISFKMYCSVNRLVFLVYLFNLCTGSITDDENSDFMKREHSLIKPYQGSRMVMQHWDFTGSTIITENHIRLTPDLQSKKGALWNIVPCQVRNWELVVHFRIHGKGQELFGDGMAIWYARDRMQLGEVFGNQDYHHGLGVLIDTYSNHNGPHAHQHPYISAMVNNGTLHYDHDRDGTHTQLAGCEAKVRNLDQPTYISIRYEGETLTVSTDVENKAEWKQCLSVKGIRLPTGYYFGLTAATGDLSDNHDVLSVRLYEIDQPLDDKDEDRSKIVPSAAFFEPPRDHVDDPKPSSLSGIKVFLLVLIGIIALVACVVIGIMFYQKQQEQTRKRFY